MYYILGLLLIFYVLCVLVIYCSLILASRADDAMEDYFKQKDKS